MRVWERGEGNGSWIVGLGDRAAVAGNGLELCCADWMMWVIGFEVECSRASIGLVVMLGLRSRC